MCYKNTLISLNIRWKYVIKTTKSTKIIISKQRYSQFKVRQGITTTQSTENTISRYSRYEHTVCLVYSINIVYFTQCFQYMFYENHGCKWQKKGPSKLADKKSLKLRPNT